MYVTFLFLVCDHRELRFTVFSSLTTNDHIPAAFIFLRAAVRQNRSTLKRPEGHRADISELRMICQNKTFSALSHGSLFHHGLIHIRCGQATLPADPIGPEKAFGK